MLDIIPAYSVLGFTKLRGKAKALSCVTPQTDIVGTWRNKRNHVVRWHSEQSWRKMENCSKTVTKQPIQSEKVKWPATSICTCYCQGLEPIFSCCNCWICGQFWGLERMETAGRLPLMGVSSMMGRWLEGAYLQVSEGVQHETQRESGLVQQSLSLRDAAQCAPEGPEHNTHTESARIRVYVLNTIIVLCFLW